MGQVFPGATTHFGMVQLSPKTNFEVMFQKDGSYNTETYEYCAGYQHRDSTIIGFAHTILVVQDIVKLANTRITVSEAGRFTWDKSRHN